MSIHNGGSKVKKKQQKKKRKKENTKNTKKNLVGRNVLHFSTSANSKLNESRLSTLSILPDHIKDYKKIQKQRALGNYFCRKMVSKLATQSGDDTDQNGGRYPILGANFGYKPKI